MVKTSKEFKQKSKGYFGKISRGSLLFNVSQDLENLYGDKVAQNDCRENEIIHKAHKTNAPVKFFHTTSWKTDGERYHWYVYYMQSETSTVTFQIDYFAGRGKVNIFLDTSLNIQCRTYLPDIPRISVHWDHSRVNLQMFPLNMAEVFVSRKFYLQVQRDQKTPPSVFLSGVLPE